MRIFDDRRLDLGGGIRALAPLRLERVEPFPDAPAVVASILNEVDHFPEVLPDIAGPELAGLTVEAELPDVSQPDAVHLGCPVRESSGTPRRIVGRYSVSFSGRRMIDVDP